MRRAEEIGLREREGPLLDRGEPAAIEQIEPKTEEGAHPSGGDPELNRLAALCRRFKRFMELSRLSDHFKEAPDEGVIVLA